MATVRACRVSDLPASGSSVCFTAAGRSLLLLRHGDALHCLDAHCGHMGADLREGDIEELGGIVALRCPWCVTGPARIVRCVLLLVQGCAPKAGGRNAR